MKSARLPDLSCSDRTPQSLKALAKDYLQEVPPDLATLKKGGFEAWHDKSTGQDMVLIAAHMMTTSAAAKQGLV